MQKSISFPFEKVRSKIFSQILRPVAQVYFYSRLTNLWIPIWGIVDTGADYTLLPKGYAQKFGVDIKKDCKEYSTFGVGGEEKSYIYYQGLMKIGEWERNAPIGFLARSDIPPLFGRQGFLETFEVIFKNYETIFREI